MGGRPAFPPNSDRRWSVNAGVDNAGPGACSVPLSSERVSATPSQPALKSHAEKVGKNDQRGGHG